MLKDFLQKKTGTEKEAITKEDEKSLENMKILNDGRCTLAGLLLLGKKTYPLFSQYQISAVSWYGNEPGVKDYRESEDIKGNVLILYEESLAFIKRQLRKLQMGQHVNSIGILEIPSINPILLSHIKDIEGIPYRGTGIGVKRILKACEEYQIDVEFDNQIENNQFKVTFWRK